jgi:hypothetical protein
MDALDQAKADMMVNTYGMFNNGAVWANSKFKSIQENLYKKIEDLGGNVQEIKNVVAQTSSEKAIEEFYNIQKK